MHSRIFQITISPVPFENWVTSSEFDCDHWFTQSIADYVTSVDDRAESLSWLAKTLFCNNSQYEQTDDGFVLHEGFKETFYEDAIRYSYQVLIIYPVFRLATF